MAEKSMTAQGLVEKYRKLTRGFVELHDGQYDEEHCGCELCAWAERLAAVESADLEQSPTRAIERLEATQKEVLWYSEYVQGLLDETTIDQNREGSVVLADLAQYLRDLGHECDQARAELRTLIDSTRTVHGNILLNERAFLRAVNLINEWSNAKS